MKKRSLVMGVALCVCAMRVGAEMLGFWDFKDGMPGEDVTAFSNSAGSGIYSGTGCANSTMKPVYTNDAPGLNVYSDASGGTRLCSHPQSLAFNYPAGATSAAGGGYAIIADLAAVLSKKSAYTIEYFVKFDKDFDYYAGGGYKFYSKSSLWVGNGATGYKIVTPNTSQGIGHAIGVSLQTFTRDSSFATTAGSVQDNRDYSDGQWHHVAVVYGDGKITLFSDRQQVGNSFALSNTDGTGQSDVDFVLGTGRSAKRSTEPFHGQISCLRVSDDALTTDQFLHVDNTPEVTPGEVVGFWDFSDGTPGADIATITNRLAPDTFAGTAAATTQRVPTYSDATPGRYVFSDGNKTNLLAASPLSAYFGEGTYDNGGRISLASLATALMRLDEYTVEFFFKVDVPSMNNWRTLVAWKYGDRSAVKANLTNNGTTYNACALESLCNTTGNTLVSVGNGALSRDLGTSWHHFAAVYTRADNAIWYYIDKAKSSSAAVVTNQTTVAQHPLVLGNSAFDFKQQQEVFGGNIACVRVTARALGTREFMVVADKLVPVGTVFTLNFEEGTSGAVLPAGGSTIGTAASSYPDGIATYIPYNLHAGCRPQYAPSLRTGRMINWGEEAMWTNNLCLRFPAGADLPEGTANRGYYGAMLEFPRQDDVKYNPSSWTMEAFVRLEKLGLSAATVPQGLIFGKAGNRTPTSNNPVYYPRSAWLLSYTRDGKLKLEWTERPSPEFSDYDSSSEYYKSVTTAQAYFTDLSWHHVALSYDATARKFQLYFDGEPVLCQSLVGTDATLYDGDYSYFFCRFPTTGGLEGCLDEIRFSSKVLVPDQFEQFPNLGTLVIFR